MKRHTPDCGRFKLQHLTGVLLLSLLAAFTSAGCGDDPAAAYSLVLRADRTTLTADGSDVAVITVSVLDQNFNPPPIGSSVRLVSSPSGNVNDTGEVAGVSVTDPLGFAEFSVACTDEETIQVFADFDGDRGALQGAITCREPPSGEWQLQISAEPRRLPTSASASITVAATDEAGQPVPEETGVTLTITSGDLLFSRGGTELSRGTDASGRIATTVVAGESGGTATVCAQFTDPRFGAAQNCVALVIGDDLPPESTCIATFSAARIPADGRTVASLTLSVFDESGTPVEAAFIEAEAASGTFLSGPAGDALGTRVELDTDINGDVTTYVRAPSIAGAAGVEATALYDDPDNGETVELECIFDQQLTFFGPPVCEFSGMSPELLGVQDSGVSDTGQLTYCFRTSEGASVGAGERVDFSWHIRLAGAQLTATSALTDAAGCVSVEVETGVEAGLLEVRASLPFGETESTCTSGPQPVRGGRPTENGWVLRCESINAAALIESEGSEIFTPCEIQCSTYLRDRFGNPIDGDLIDTQVFFAAEQGTIVSPVRPDANGLVTTTWRPNGGLPSDVAPVTGEPTAVTDFGTQEITINPRDMMVTITAWTNGEEAFYDRNGNGFYDSGEIFVDAPEPYGDHDDNDQYNPEFPSLDRFFDVETPERDVDGQWNEANGRWDVDTVIWNKTNVVLTGAPALDSFNDLGYRDIDNLPITDPSFGPSYYIITPEQGAVLTVPVGGSTAPSRVTGSNYAFVDLLLRDRYLNVVGGDNSVAMEMDCETANVELVTDEVAYSATRRGYAVERVLRAYDAAGSETTGIDAAFRAWETLISNFGDALVQGIIDIERAENPQPSTCILESLVDVTVTPECTDATVVARLPMILEYVPLGPEL